MSSKDMALVPDSIPEARELATAYAKSSLLPDALRGKEPDIFVTIMAGLELGLAPMVALRTIQVIQGKPVLSADAKVAIVLGSGLCEYFICVHSDSKSAIYQTRRVGAPKPQELVYTIEQAKHAGLTTKDNWKRHPKEMLRARAKGALASDAYPDALAGCYTPDEIESDRAVVVDAEVIEFPETEETQTEEKVDKGAELAARVKQKK